MSNRITQMECPGGYPTYSYYSHAQTTHPQCAAYSYYPQAHPQYATQQQPQPPMAFNAAQWQQSHAAHHDTLQHQEASRCAQLQAELQYAREQAAHFQQHAAHFQQHAAMLEKQVSQYIAPAQRNDHNYHATMSSNNNIFEFDSVSSLKRAPKDHQGRKSESLSPTKKKAKSVEPQHVLTTKMLPTKNGQKDTRQKARVSTLGSLKGAFNGANIRHDYDAAAAPTETQATYQGEEDQVKLLKLDKSWPGRGPTYTGGLTIEKFLIYRERSCNKSRGKYLYLCSCSRCRDKMRNRKTWYQVSMAGFEREVVDGLIDAGKLDKDFIDDKGWVRSDVFWPPTPFNGQRSQVRTHLNNMKIENEQLEQEIDELLEMPCIRIVKQDHRNDLTLQDLNENKCKKGGHQRWRTKQKELKPKKRIKKGNAAAKCTEQSNSRAAKKPKTENLSDVASARNPPRQMQSSQKRGRAASRQPIDVDSRSDDDEDDDAFPARNLPRRKRSSQKPGHAASQPIEIGSSDDDDDDSVTMTSTAAAITTRKNVYRKIDAVRVAIGKKVFSIDCKVVFPASGELEISYKKPIQEGRFTRSKSPKLEQLLHMIKLDDELLELKYYLDDTEDLDNDQDDGDTVVNFLALRVKKTKDNKLDTVTNAYKPDGNVEEKRFIAIEFRSDKDFKNLIANFASTPSLNAFISGAQLEKADAARAFCKTLIDDSKKEQRQRLQSSSSLAEERTGFLAGKKNEDVVLVYPFGDDGEEVDAAAHGLTELACVIRARSDEKARGEGTFESTASDDTDQTSTQSNEDSNEKGNGNRVESRAVFEIKVADFLRLEPEIYLNDTLIDFWFHWIWRNIDKTEVHVFTSHFYTTLAKEGPEAVEKWTKKRGINIFKKKFVFIPINKSLHWSLCVVVNPGAIMEHIEFLKIKKTGASLEELFGRFGSKPFPFLLFFDSMKTHKKKFVRKMVLSWLNSEWARLQPDATDGSPFKDTTMKIYSPRVPYQDNSWDCGVFVCRYAYALQCLRFRSFSYEECDFFDPRRNVCETLITESAEFDFSMIDIARIREELKVLIERLSEQYLPWKQEQDRKRKEERLARKRLKNRNSDELKENGSTNVATGHSQPSVASSNSSQAVEVVVGKELAELQAATAKQKMIANSSARSRSTKHSNTVSGLAAALGGIRMEVDVPLRKTAENPDSKVEDLVYCSSPNLLSPFNRDREKGLALNSSDVLDSKVDHEGQDALEKTPLSQHAGSEEAAMNVDERLESETQETSHVSSFSIEPRFSPLDDDRKDIHMYTEEDSESKVEEPSPQKASLSALVVKGKGSVPTQNSDWV